MAVLTMRVTCVALKSTPMVLLFVLEKVSSTNRVMRHVLPTPASPTTSSLNVVEYWPPGVGSGSCDGLSFCLASVATSQKVATEDDERGGVDGTRGVAGERAAGVRYERVALDGVVLPLILYDLEDVRAVDVVIVGEQPKVHLRKGGWGGVHLRGGVWQGEGVWRAVGGRGCWRAARSAPKGVRQAKGVWQAKGMWRAKGVLAEQGGRVVAAGRRLRAGLRVLARHGRPAH
eukprot:scaffold9181_cov40-Phaeocystis_antarctica.AAC.2